MNDKKRLYDLLFEVENCILDLSDDAEKAYTITDDIINDHCYYAYEKMSHNDRTIFQESYPTIQIKERIVLEYTYKMKNVAEKLAELHDKIAEWYNNHKEE